MEQRLTILVTGGNKGIGLQLLLQLVKSKEFPVSRLLFTVRSQEKGQETKNILDNYIKANLQEISVVPKEISFYLLDLTKTDQIATLTSSLKEQAIVLDFIIFNAGVSLKSRHQTLGMVQKTLDVSHISNYQLLDTISDPIFLIHCQKPPVLIKSPIFPPPY